MSRKPISQHDVQPTFTGFLERIKQKNAVQASTPKASSTNLHSIIQKKHDSPSAEELRDEVKTSIISIGSSDDSWHIDNSIKTEAKMNNSNTSKEDSEDDFKIEKLIRNRTYKQKLGSKLKLRQLSDSEDDAVIKPSLSLNRKKRSISSNESSISQTISQVQEDELRSNVILETSSESDSTCRTETKAKRKTESTIKSPRTPVKYTKERNGNIVISDSDSTLDFKRSPKGTPTKRWIGPDLKLNLKPLGLGKELDPWIQSAKERPVMSPIPVTKHKLEDRCKELKDFQMEILEKFCNAIIQIPIPVLEKFPQFNEKTFLDLRLLYQHAKAKTRLVETKLTRLKSEEEQNSVNDRLSDITDITDTFINRPEVRHEVTNNCKDNSINSKLSEIDERINYSPLNKESEIVKQQSIISISDNDSFTISNANISELESSYMKVQTDSSPINKMNDKNIETKEQKSNAGALSLNSPPVQKKSAFQLKRPIKATVDSQISKQIIETWKKEAESKTIGLQSSISYLNANTSSNITPKSNRITISNMKTNVDFDITPESNQSTTSNLKTNTNFDITEKSEKMNIYESAYFKSKKEDQFEIKNNYGGNFEIPVSKENRNNHIDWDAISTSNTDNISYSEDIIDYLEDIEQLPALSEECNIKTTEPNTQATSIQGSNHSESDKENKIKQKNVQEPIFTGNYKNDGASNEFTSLTYPHSREMLKVFRQKFGLY
ncbi:uncharacterized protein LOC108626313, partial [Ceratina calcarata]|uniref:Uncharacterized protein LOC108626313 n=1 Tax=Ceratina calcarata TaxID=156304 RepID=A0AAJ7N8N2_9HYME